jgi:hypothetical protein
MRRLAQDRSITTVPAMTRKPDRTPDWKPAEVANHFATALRHHQAGDLRAAEHHYRKRWPPIPATSTAYITSACSRTRSDATTSRST